MIKNISFLKYNEKDDVLGSFRAVKDTVRVLNSNAYINEKGMLLKAIDNLYNLGYYKYNETLFVD